MGRPRKLRAGKKKKRVLVKVIDRTDENGRVRQPYLIMEELVDQHHSHLAKAKIALAWRLGWKEDRDSRLILGQARKATDLDREMHTYDFVILLNHEAWNAAEFSEKQMRALLDHELCHCEVVKENGEPKTDEQGRICWRIRRHDVEEFNEIVGRHGLWKRDLEKFAKVAIEKTSAPLLKMAT